MSDDLVARLRDDIDGIRELMDLAPELEGVRRAGERDIARLEEIVQCIGELAAERDAALTDLGRTQRELDVIHGYIPVLRAERDTLAEMVRLFDPSIEFTTEVPAPGWWMSTKAGRVEVARVITPDQAERFQQVLDRITKETGDE